MHKFFALTLALALLFGLASGAAGAEEAEESEEFEFAGRVDGELLWGGLTYAHESTSAGLALADLTLDVADKVVGGLRVGYGEVRDPGEIELGKKRMNYYELSGSYVALPGLFLGGGYKWASISDYDFSGLKVGVKMEEEFASDLYLNAGLSFAPRISYENGDDDGRTRGTEFTVGVAARTGLAVDVRAGYRNLRYEPGDEMLELGGFYLGASYEF